jgi:hypothetical protein
MIEILDDLYGSEMNWRITTFWDAGYHVEFGDGSNGWRDATNTDTIQEAVDALKTMAIEIYPESDFAKKYG